MQPAKGREQEESQHSSGGGTATLERYFAAAKRGREETEQANDEELNIKCHSSSRINTDLNANGNVNINDAAMASCTSRENRADDSLKVVGKSYVTLQTLSKDTG